MTQLCALEAEGNGFSAASVVGCEGWRAAGLSCSSDSVFFCSSFSVLMQYAVSVDRVSFADLNRHPLLPAALLRRIEASDPLLTSVTIDGDRWIDDASKWIGPHCVVSLADALHLNTCITSLSLAGHKLGSDGLKTLMAAVTRLTGLTSLNISRNELSADDCALVCGAAAGAGMTQLCALEAEGNEFSAASVVGCEGWRAAGCRNLTTTLFVSWAAVDTRA